MQCPRCQHDNPAHAKFCLDCGARLALSCTKCRAELPGSARFCLECGEPVAGQVQARSPESYTPTHLVEKIRTSKAALEGERKQVTVLFADLKGSMELLADRDPEEARKILDPVLERMMEAVHRYEGTVNQVMGDGIMALFGAPLAHEDHAVRACYAALRMQESVTQYAEQVRRSHAAVVKIRIGLNSGEVVVRAIGSDLHMDYTAVGQTTHLAARMEQLAEPGAIVITPGTLALAEGYVEVTSLGPVPVKGLAEPVEVYEVTGAGSVRTRLQAATRRGLTRFVGRDTEVEQLRRALQLAGNGRGQVAAIVGEAGVGKSRLFYEFTHSHRLQGWLVLESASVSYGKATSYLPVIDLLKGYFKIGDRDDHREMRDKVLGRVLGLDRALEPLLPPLLALLDVPVEDAAWQNLDPPQRRQCTLDAVKGLLLREAREQPLLVIFEDLHWIDTETQALLDGLVESLGSARLLLLVNYRPEYRHAWGSRTYYSQMRLDVLPAESAGELLEALLGDDLALGPLKQLLVKRGNPFFLEETVQTLVETKALVGERGRYRLTQPVQTIQVPATVQVILAARIDRLAPEQKRLLQVAAVVGKDVPFALLQAIADLPDDGLRIGLDQLQAAEFVYETRMFPDLEYAFKHALTHEVAYGSLLRERRRDLHARIVDAIETLHRDRLGGEIERLAYHAVRGGLRERAIPYLRQAGLKATARSALQDARTWFDEALTVLEALPEHTFVLEQALDIRIELRPVLNQLGDVQRSMDRLRQAETLAERLNDELRRGRVHALIATTHTNLGQFDEALRRGTSALEIADRVGDLRLRILTRTYLAEAHAQRGDYTRALELTSGTLAALPSHSATEQFDAGAALPAAIYNRLLRTVSLAALGRFTEAAEPAAAMIRLVEATRHSYTVGMAYWGAAHVPLAQGSWMHARSLLDQSVEVLRAGHIVMNLPRVTATAAYVLAELGEASEAAELVRESQDLLAGLAPKGITGWQGPTYQFLGRASLALGRLDEAKRFGDRAVQVCSQRLGNAADAHRLLGDIAVHSDPVNVERAEAHYRETLVLSEPRAMRPLTAHCHLGLGKLYRRTGRREQARDALTTATTMYREMGMTYWLEQAETETKERL